jgi:hypothetical protein
MASSIADTVNAVRVSHIVGTHVSCLCFLRLTKAKGGDMRGDELLKRDELLKADMLSEIVLLSSGVAILVALVMVVVAALTSAVALQ